MNFQTFMDQPVIPKDDRSVHNPLSSFTDGGTVVAPWAEAFRGLAFSDAVSLVLMLQAAQNFRFTGVFAQGRRLFSS